MPTTTASFVDSELIPSRFSVAALVVLYSGAALLLLFLWLRADIPFVIVLFCFDLLLHESLALLTYCYAQQGRLVISRGGEIRWQMQKWHIKQVKIRNRFFLLLRISNLADSRWLLIGRDSCDEATYRALSLLCFNSVTFLPPKE